MKDMHSPDHGPVSCPNCGGEARELVTVNSGPWERQFLECSACGQALVAAWRNTHDLHVTTTALVDLTAASQSAA